MQMTDSRCVLQNALSFMFGVSKLHEVLFSVLEVRAKDKRKKRKRRVSTLIRLTPNHSMNHMSHNGETFLIARTMR